MTENLFDPQNIRKMIIFFNKKMINKFFEQKEDEITVDQWSLTYNIIEVGHNYEDPQEM